MSRRAQVLRRAAAGTLAAAAVAATAGVAAAPASAATPPNLRLTGVVFCDKTNFIPTLVRQMTVTNTSDTFTMRNVTLQEIQGQKRFAASLAPGKTLQIRTTQPGCFPSSISGYAISDNREDLLDNYGYWYTLDRL
ncbi:MAG: hypothetical protein PGN29_15870 [Gordonia paraffinivorans]